MTFFLAADAGERSILNLLNLMAALNIEDQIILLQCLEAHVGRTLNSVCTLGKSPSKCMKFNKHFWLYFHFNYLNLVLQVHPICVQTRDIYYHNKANMGRYAWTRK